MDRQRKKWESILAKYGLSLVQLKKQDLQTRTLLPTVDFQPHQFDCELDGAWKLRALNKISYEETARFHLVSVRNYHRQVPDWALSNVCIQRLLLLIYPNLWKDYRQLRAAMLVNAMLYRYFRLLEPDSLIAADLGLTRKALKFRIHHLRTIAPKLLFDN